MDDGVTRVRFLEGQFLGVDDLAVEQAHHSGAFRRHLLGAHVWGVLSGLGLRDRPGGFVVEPGAAVDGYGRFLSVPDPVPVDVAGASGTRDVWLCATDGAPMLCVAPAGNADPRRPPGVPPGDLDLAPHASVTPSAGPWPVLIGRVGWSGAQVDVDTDGRPLAGQAGETVTAPSGRARMQVGSGPDGDRFAVATRPAGAGPRQIRLAVDAAGDLTVHGSTALGGVMTAAPPGPGGVRFAPVVAPATAAPWTCYRTRIERDGRMVDQLRIEIGHPGDGGDPARNRWVIGWHGGGTGPFRPALSVDAGGTVTVHGDLDVTGLLSEGPIRPEATDPRFAAAASSGFLAGMAGTAGRTAAFFSGAEFVAPELAVTFPGTPAQPVTGQDHTFTVQIDNTGSAAAAFGQLYVVVTVAGKTQPAVRLLDGARFEPAKKTTVTHTVRVPPQTGGEDMTVAASVVAVGPFADTVSAEQSRTVQVRSGFA